MTSTVSSTGPEAVEDREAELPPRLADDGITVNLMQFDREDRDAIGDILGVPEGQHVGVIKFPAYLPEAGEARKAFEAIHHSFEKLHALQSATVRTDLTHKRELVNNYRELVDHFSDAKAYQRIRIGDNTRIIGYLVSNAPHLATIAKSSLYVAYGALGLFGVAFIALAVHIGLILGGH